MPGFTFGFATLSEKGAVTKHTVEITPEELAAARARSSAQRSATISKEANQVAPLLATDEEVDREEINPQEEDKKKRHSGSRRRLIEKLMPGKKATAGRGLALKKSARARRFLRI